MTNPEIIKDIILVIKTRGHYSYYGLLRSLRQNLIFCYIFQGKY